MPQNDCGGISSSWLSFLSSDILACNERSCHLSSCLKEWVQLFLHRARYGLVLDVSVHGESTSVEVEAADRAKIESVFSVFENALESSRLPKPSPPAPPKPAIFIGQGHSPVWRDLKDHLHEHHGYQVEAYETGARAGHAIRDILAELVDVSSFALLVLTAEDEHADGTMHARENIIHEAGLFHFSKGALNMGAPSYCWKRE
jgi:hypothetical protein